MKKIVALALSVVMVLACFCVFAVADDEAASEAHIPEMDWENE